MFALLIVLLIAELYVMVQVASWIGVLETIALLVLMPIVGIWLVKRAGVGVLRRLRCTVDSGALPHKEVVDGFLLLLAGLLLIVSGFITGAAGLLLLLPPVRVGVRALLFRSFKRRGSFAIKIVDGMGRRVDLGGGRGVYDVGSRDATERRPHTPNELDP